MRGHRNLVDLRFPGIIAEQFRLVKVIKESDLLHLVKLFSLTFKRALVHQGDLLCQEVQLATDSIQLPLQGANDGDEDLLVHLIQLFGSKFSKVNSIAPLSDGMIIP